MSTISFLPPSTTNSSTIVEMTGGSGQSFTQFDTACIDSSTATTVLVTAGIWAEHYTTDIYQVGTGSITIAAADGVTINSIGGKSSLAGQFAHAQLFSLGSNTWILSGDLA